MGRKTVVKKYIPSQITKEWSDDGKSVKYIKKSDLSLEECLIDDMFSETFIVDFGLKTDDEDLYLPDTFPGFLDSIKNDDKEVLKDNEAYIALLLSSQYYLNRNSDGAFYVYRQNNIDKIRNINSDELLSDFVCEILSRTRKYSERAYSMFLAVINGMYLFDLKCTLLYADGNTSFVMGDQPMVMLNFLGRNYNLLSNPFIYHGLILLMPITPKIAVCVYDDSVYKIKKKNGKVVLSDEDVSLVNRYIVAISEKIIYSESEEREKDYILSLLEKKEGMKDLEDSTLSVFRILASSIDLDSLSIREYCDELMYYDEEHSVGDENYNSDRIDYINELLKSLEIK